MKPPKLTTRAELYARGRALRGTMPRKDIGKWRFAERDVIGVIRQVNKGRIAKLIPLKMARMAVSPFAFYRGSVQLMAGDLATQPVSGIHAQLCGDAHLQNLGAFASHHGELVFDLNDFDETIFGPWEWDLKRLATSIMLAGREAGQSDADCLEAVRAMARRYRRTVREITRLPVLRLADYTLVRTRGAGPVRRILEKAERKTAAEQMSKRSEPDASGMPRFRTLPLQTPVSETEAGRVIASFRHYRETLTVNHQAIFDSYRAVDVAFKVVGTGSVGTRDYIVMMFGTSLHDPLFLQIKEATASCYAPYLPENSAPTHNGQRVAQGQQRMQIVTDPFLGWTTIESRHFLVRQLADRKAAISPGDLGGSALAKYAMVCGESLAKAHSRTGDGATLAGYMGRSDRVAGALAGYARRYADQVEADYFVFMNAISRGVLPVADDPLL